MTLHRHVGSPAEQDDLLRALGRFVVRFSWFVHRMETETAGMLQWTNRQDVIDAFNAEARKNVKLPSEAADPGRSGLYRQVMGVLSRMNSTERRLKTYFAVCEAFGRLVWTDDDRQLVEAAKAEALAINEKRKRLLHDAWAVLGVNAVEISDQSTPSLLASRSRSRATGPQVEQATTEGLNADADYVERLTDVVGVMRMVQFQVEADGAPAQSYSTLFKLDSDGRRVVRRDRPLSGPAAAPQA